MLLEIPAFEQERAWSCLPACLRMCMAACGDTRSEEAWREFIGATPIGVTIENAHASLERIGVECQVGHPTLSELEEYLAISQPVILAVGIGVQGPMIRRHAVVLVGATGGDFLINDPATGETELWGRLELAEAMDFAGGKALVMPPV